MLARLQRQYYHYNHRKQS